MSHDLPLFPALVLLFLQLLLLLLPLHLRFRRRFRRQSIQHLIRNPIPMQECHLFPLIRVIHESRKDEEEEAQEFQIVGRDWADVD